MRAAYALSPQPHGRLRSSQLYVTPWSGADFHQAYVFRNKHYMMTSSNGNIFRVTGRPFVLGIHRSPVNSPHKGQWRGVLMFSLICAWINGWVNNRKAGDLRRHRIHYDVTVMLNSHGVVKRSSSRRCRCKPCMSSYLWHPHNSSWDKVCTVECRYNAAQYITILHASLQILMHSINHSLNPQNTSHTSP